MGDRETPLTPNFFDCGSDPDLQRYGTIVNTVDDGLYQLDADGCIVAANDTIVERTGYDRDELFGEHVSIIVDEDDVERLEREIRMRLETNTDPDTSFDLTLTTDDGGHIACELRFSLLVNDGEFDGTVGILRDVDERHYDFDHLTALWEQHKSISTVIDEADVGVFVVDENATVVWVDETAESYFDLTRSAVIGRDKHGLIEDTIQHRVADPDSFKGSVLETHEDDSADEQFEYHITPGPGRDERWVEHRSKPIEAGEYAGGQVDLYYDITDRKESRLAKRESEQGFQSLVDAVEEYAIFRLDTDGRVASWNGGAERIKGYESREILGEPFSVFYTDADRENDVPERNLEAARRSGSVEDEGWRVRADGSTFWANVTITALKEDGELQGYAKVTRDMTERREREQQLQRERDLTDRILETSPVGIALVNPDGSSSRANERMAELFSQPETDASTYDSGDRELFDGEDDSLTVEEQPAGRVFETGEPVYDREIRLHQSDGTHRWLSINAAPIPDDQGDPVQAVVTATDITDLKELVEQRKQELEEREKELATVQLVTNLLDTDDQSVDELLTEFVTELPHSFQQPASTEARVAVGTYEATTAGYEPLDRTITARTSTAGGTPITIGVLAPETGLDADADQFLDEERQLIETLATLLKFYFDRQEYIDNLQEETRRLEQFAYAASHDLQEPLRMVSSYLQLIESRYGNELDADGREFLEFAVDGAERMRSMITGLLAYSRVETRGDPFDAVDLNDVLDDVVANLELRIEATNADVTVGTLPTVEGDSSQLQQLFQNLLENAIKYNDGEPQIHVRAEQMQGKWQITVRDDGIGIDSGDQDRIFDVFQRLHSHEEHDGTGIGLALCQRIVERHSGQIWVDSEPGNGSTFSFTLPSLSTTLSAIE
ncbi:PAS domain S-box protein [Natrialbaceae archaeon A-CW3]